MVAAILLSAVMQVDFKLAGTINITTTPQPSNRSGCFVTVRQGAFSVTARGEDMSYTLAVGTQVHVQVSYVDAAGNPAVVDGDVVWSSSNEAIAAVAVDPADSTRALMRAAGTLGQAQITATADADIGEGVRALITPMDVEVVAGEAVAGTIAPVGGAEPIPRVEHH